MALMDDLRSCPGCGQRMFEWVDREQVGWCLSCGYFEYYASYQEFIAEKSTNDE